MASSTRSLVSTTILLLVASVAAQVVTVTAPSPTTATTATSSTTPASSTERLAQTVTVTATVAPSGSTVPSITAVSDCHTHGTANWCMAGTEEYQIIGPTATEEFQAQYTGCHTHGSDTFCVDDAGEDVEILVGTAAESGEAVSEDPAGSEEHCHFHAGVEHCVGGSESEESNCDATDRNYNIGLRVGLLFVILTTSAIGVFIPIITTRFKILSKNNIIFIILKQFGTGIVISTAFIHLFTHAELMFGNDCLGELKYEGTTAAIFMAGLFLSFLMDYIGARFVQWRQNKLVAADPEDRHVTDGDKSETSASSTPDNKIVYNHGHSHGHSHGAMRGPSPMEEKINVWNLEAGIIFHSILIGITLVVAGDTFFITLFIVILFHQMFEGIALGTCIAELPTAAATTVYKCLMAGLFALITPIGMGIGIGVLNKFNGNDPSTIIAIGTLDAFSAGILAWVGIVEMLARDWLHGRLANASLIRTVCAMLALISGMVLMSVLGKWA
ncbi:Zip-domain-containing protein [Dothidotthia symphoricarpi CBS 119687]|uniref:Zip-domain-containing protein n=1 Tax=Dothidotthia symphoricarpi CBS 119687 TaxID=1392245 RepID=A0A6A6AVR3_9PLEO|nr:Zip-domain-containing protein [Dothidotthia symphoricarpi CBS 119687]KAF2135044.1 Zip-domain-containing protein [Dothidotthia symphoricarpi CBS 119687]